jgi:hypothetical protein
MTIGTWSKVGCAVALTAALVGGIAIDGAEARGAESSPKQADSARDAKSQRTPVELRRAVEAALAADAAAVKPAERTAAVRKLAALAREVAAHPTLAKSAQTSLHARIAARLKAEQREIETQLAAAKPSKPAARPAHIAAKQGRDAILGQAAGPVFGPPDAPADGAQELSDLIQEVIAPPTWEPAGGNGVIRIFGKTGRGAADLLAQVPGAPAGGNAGGNGAAAGSGPFELTENTGQQLVELIQEVVAPQSWDANGGEGKIVFLPGRNVLVVRATGDTHEALGDLIGQLRGN